MSHYRNHVQNSLLEHKIAHLRAANTGHRDFRDLIGEIALIIGCKAVENLPMKKLLVNTPMGVAANARVIDCQEIVLAPVMRAGLAMVEGLLQLLPMATVSHIGLYRNEGTLEAVKYYHKFPEGLENPMVFILDPMLATGGSAISAIQLIKDKGAKNIKLLSIIAARPGLEAVNTAHPDVEVYYAALDEELNEHGYIVPGLGDAGDRIFGTK
jgi:uracil phosphoribosyltransferase